MATDKVVGQAINQQKKHSWKSGTDVRALQETSSLYLMLQKSDVLNN